MLRARPCVPVFFCRVTDATRRLWHACLNKSAPPEQEKTTRRSRGDSSGRC
jgi:hypothetical protein